MRGGGIRNFDQTQYHQRFQTKVIDTVRAGPVENQNRSCTDICCFITFFVIIAATVVLGVIMINDGSDVFETSFTTQNTQGFAVAGQAFTNHAGIIIGMFVFSILLSIVFLLLVKNFPKCMVWGMIFLAIIGLIALIVIGAINSIWYLVIVCGISLLIIFCIIGCCRDRIRIGIRLLEVAADFITQKPTVYLAPLYPLIFSILYFVFWIAAFMAGTYTRQQKSQKNQSTTRQDVFLGVYIFFFVFATYFFYYVQTFLISTACAYWYYNIDVNYFTTGAWRINRYHLGSLTFAALIVAIINLLKRLVQQESRDQFGDGNFIIGCCLCILGCCLSCIEGLLHVLNHNAVIVMAVTGQSYISSAKSAISLIFQNFGVFYIIDFISDLVNFFGILVCVGIPTILGICLIAYVQDAPDKEVVYSSILIFFLSLMFATIIFSMLAQALSCVFIYYCFDKKFMKMGITVPNVPATIRQFDRAGPYQDQNPGTAQQLRERR